MRLHTHSGAAGWVILSHEFVCILGRIALHGSVFAHLALVWVKGNGVNRVSMTSVPHD